MDESKHEDSVYTAALRQIAKDAAAEALKMYVAGDDAGGHALTKESILAIKDRRQRQQAIRDNIDLFVGGA